MALHLEDLLPAVTGPAPGDPGAARAVFARLQFLARLLPRAPEASGCRALLLWQNERGDVAWARVRTALVIVGRDATCDVVLTSPRVSRRHCAVGWRERPLGGPTVQDLGSSNGTIVNGRPIPAGTAYPLNDGDVIEVGGVALAAVLAR